MTSTEIASLLHLCDLMAPAGDLTTTRLNGAPIWPVVKAARAYAEIVSAPQTNPPTPAEFEVMAPDREPDFLETLQGYASMCERDAIDKDDGPMLARKFRDAAFVISTLQKLRDELRAALAASPPAPAVAQDEEDVGETAWRILLGFYAGKAPLPRRDFDAAVYPFVFDRGRWQRERKALLAENARLQAKISELVEIADNRFEARRRAEADANRLAEALRPLADAKIVEHSDGWMPSELDLRNIEADDITDARAALAEHDEASAER